MRPLITYFQSEGSELWDADKTGESAGVSGRVGCVTPGGACIFRPLSAEGESTFCSRLRENGNVNPLLRIVVLGVFGTGAVCERGLFERLVNCGPIAG